MQTKDTIFPNWYNIKNIECIDSPALVVYTERIIENIRLLRSMVSQPDHLRVHVKTHKMAAVCQLQLQHGITKFKCATIAEAEMLAMESAPDVLLAYQPAGPKIERLVRLAARYPATSFSCLVDNFDSAQQISAAAAQNGFILPVYIDLNGGMNRTGIVPEKAAELVSGIVHLPGIRVAGLHAYDGHIRDTDPNIRQQKSDASFARVSALSDQIFSNHHLSMKIVVGGSPTFPTHALRKGVECSPGTFIFWDWGYKHILPDEPFDYAALVITRVISIVGSDTICTDLGHKSVGAENPLPRVHFLNAPLAEPVGQSEEHLVLRVADSSDYRVGDVLYGVPVHICPTVALYDRAYVIEDGEMTTSWKVTARDRIITI